jgi:FMN-dependent NADH-azoreductase
VDQEKIKPLKHYIPIFILGNSFVCGKCNYKSTLYDQIINHFKKAHLQAYIKQIQLFDNNVKELRQKYQGVETDGSDLTGYER